MVGSNLSNLKSNLLICCFVRIVIVEESSIFNVQIRDVSVS